MMEPIRIIYHPAPGPAANGRIVEVPPVNLGSDQNFALTWIRRRLGIIAPTDRKLLRFSSQIVPLPEPVSPEESLAALAAGPPEDGAITTAVPPEITDAQRAAVAAGLAESMAENMAAIPDLPEGDPFGER